MNIKPFWITNTPSTNYAPLNENLDVDIAVIGGGIAGITTAFLLAEEGQEVALFESLKIAEQVSGHTTAKITLNHELVYSFLIENFGKEKAQIYADANNEAIDLITDIVKDLKIDCDLYEADAYTYTLRKENLKEFKNEVKAAQSLGIKADFLSGKIGLPFEVAAAFRIKDQFRFHPRKYLLALAIKAVMNGAKIFENTKITQVEEKENFVELNTGDYKVKAKKVVITTNFPIYDPLKFYTRTFFNFSYALAAKLNAQTLKDLYLSSDDGDLHSIRPQYFSPEENIVIIGGEDHPSGYETDTKSRYSKLEQWARKNFNIKEIICAWGTHDVNSADRIPYIGQQSKKTWVITGLKEWGMTQGTLGAILVTDQILERINPWTELYNPKRIKGQITKEVISQQFEIATGVLKERLTKDKVSKLSDIKKDEGGIIEENGEKIAIVKDSDNTTHKFKPQCTHLGCFVTFNNAEKTWDCPCHGSRFDKNGKVIHSPAIESLRKK